MKKIYVLLCLLLLLSALASCEQAEERSTNVSENISTEGSNELTNETSDNISNVQAFTITDNRPEREWMNIPHWFYGDAYYSYYFNHSDTYKYIVVEYPNGTTQNVKEALEAGNITIEDLDRFGIGYMKEPKDVSN